jgi:hypothetical protein
MDDRRSKPRLNVSLDAVWDSTKGRQSARVTNLSEGGCYLDTVGETLSGELACFRILMPNEDDWLYLEGEVRHYTPGVGFGVRFLDLNQEQEENLALLIKKAKEGGSDVAPLSADLVQD